jgi:HTH-like domain
MLKGGARYLKKGGGVLRVTTAVKYAWIQQQHAEYRVSRLCRILEVSRSGYYEWLGRPPSTHADVDQQLQEKVQRYFAQGRGTYDTRRIKHRLAQEGLQVSRRRIGRLLSQSSLRCKTRRKFKAPRVMIQKLLRMAKSVSQGRHQCKRA